MSIVGFMVVSRVDRYYETLATTNDAKQRHDPEDRDRHLHRRENQRFSCV
jgi:hypothetical protein